MTDYRVQREAPRPQAPVLTQGEQAALVRRVEELERVVGLLGRAMGKLVRVSQLTGDYVAVKACREAAEGVQ